MAGPGAPADDAKVVDPDATKSLPCAPELAPPQQRTIAALSGVERFTLLKKLGEGGMGSVYAAYDGVLDRKVAVKVVRPDLRRASGLVAPRDQLLREAQAMARLSHPNVVAVHEVGELGDDVYVVLEFVDGTTLAEWQKTRPRSWREVVDAYIQAGRGLAAAHEAGLVHRDFKPNNVMIRRDGRIQVGDFGVVSMGGSSSSDGTSGEDTPPITPHHEITYAGHRVGTPAYMSPEQDAGASVDGRADQFSFCVSLWEGLYGARPFEGRSNEVQASIQAGRFRPLPATARVPRWIEMALRRGLSARAEDRWPAMEELLAELARDPLGARRRRLAIGAVGIGVMVIAIIAWVGWTRRPAATEPCTGAEAHLVHRWDAARATELRASFVASAVPYAATGATRVAEQLDAWGARWAAMRVSACRATRVTGDQSEALLDARMHCLDRQLDEVTELVGALITSDRDVIARAAQQIMLPDVDACADVETVTARVPKPGKAIDREHLASIEHALAGLRAAERTGRYHDGRLRAGPVAADALALGFAPIGAEALLIRGELEGQDGDTGAARATLVSAAELAGAAHDDAMLAQVLIMLDGILVERAEVPAALALGIAASAVTARVDDRELDAKLAEQLGAAYEAAGDPQAERYLRRALTLHETTDGKDSVDAARVLNKLAGLDARRGREAEAREEYTRALGIVIARLGPSHPATAITRANLCSLDAEAGKLTEARSCGEQVLEVLERALGPDHPQVAWALNEVALVQRDQGAPEAAAERFQRALAIWERASGPTHPDVAWPLINLGEIATERGDSARAIELCQRALDVIVRAAGSAAPDSAAALACLATALLAHAPRDAAAMARRAMEARKVRGEPPDEGVSFTLARALAATGDERGAIAAAREALSTASPPLRTQISAWLASRGSAP